MPSTTWISKLVLHHFRNYPYMVFETSPSPIVLTGLNGAGKTNILEAISLLAPSKGLRSAKNAALQHFDFPDSPWALNVTLRERGDETLINMGLDAAAGGKKKVEVDGTPTPQTRLPDWVKVFWVTPFMDQLFVESPSSRRRFFDKLVVFYVKDHSVHLSRFELAARERSRLLREGRGDAPWLTALEEQMAQESVVIVTNRVKLMRDLNALTHEKRTSFPRANLTLKGEIEGLLEKDPALTVEEKIMDKLKKARAHDALAGGTSIGAHLSDLIVYHLDFNRPAEVCSTGEQKALLLSMILAYTRLCVETFQKTPLVLLDEVAAHLDTKRRMDLFKEIQDLNVQAWMTGTDVALFSPLRHKAQFFRITHEQGPEK